MCLTLLPFFPPSTVSIRSADILIYSLLHPQFLVAGQKHAFNQDYWINLLMYFSSCICIVAKSDLTLCDPTDCSLPGFSGHGISQARILEWVSISSSRASSWPRNQTCISCIAGDSLPLSHKGSYHWSVEVGKLWPVGKTQFAYFCK